MQTGEQLGVLLSILGSVEVGVMLTDLEHHTLVSNERLGELFGFAHDKAVRNDPQAVRQWVADRIVHYAAWEQNLADVYADPLKVQLDHLELTNPYAVLERRTRPVLDENGKPFARLWTFLDRTQEHRRDKIQSFIQEISLTFDPKPSVVYQKIVRSLSEFYDTTSILSILEGDTMRFQAIASPVPGAEQMTQNALSESYCQFCMEVDSPFVVQNALDDPRHAKVLPATMGVTRYIGVPLRMSNGSVIGTLCIMDHRSEIGVTEDDVRLLSVLGMRVSTELERESHLNALEKSVESAEAKMIQSEKLAAVGTLAASIAHDIRNIVSAITLDIRQPGEAELDRLERVGAHVDRFNVLAARLLSYVRPTQIAVRPVSVRGAVQYVADLLSRHLDLAEVELVIDLPDSLSPVLADLARLEHLFMNLLLNALQASGTGGRLRVSSEERGPRVVIRVEDNGPGMTAEQIQVAFDAFQSSRNDGFGLGLYSCRQIMREIEGKIEIESEVGKGTVVSLEFQKGMP